MTTSRMSTARLAATLATAMSQIPHTSGDEPGGTGAPQTSSDDTKVALQAALTELQAVKDAKAKSSNNFKKQKNEAAEYATSARVGQVTITAGNFSALIALYKTTADQGDVDVYSNPVKALILASLGISGALLILQVLLAHVYPGKKSENGAYWQLLNGLHHRTLQFIFVLCCCFGPRPDDGVKEHGKAPDGYQPVSNPTNGPSDGDPPRSMSPMGNMNKVAPLARGATGTDTPTHPATIPEGTDSSPQKIDVVVTQPPDDAPDAEGPDSGKPPGADAGQGDDGGAPAKEPPMDPEEKEVFTEWQKDMNTTITLLGTVLTVLNALIAGLSGPDVPSSAAIAAAVAAAAHSPAAGPAGR